MSSTTNSHQVAIVGAGISGLSAAHQLKNNGVHPVLFEKNDRAGGRMASETEGDFIFDLGTIAPLGGNPQFQELVDASDLGANVSFLPTMVAGIVRNGQLHSIATDRPVKDLFGTELFSTRSKLKLAKLVWPVIKNRNLLDSSTTKNIAALDTDTAHRYVAQHLNEELADYLGSSLIRAIWAADARDKSVVQLLWTLRQFAYPIYCFPEGNGSLPLSLAKQHDVSYNCDVNVVESSDQGVQLEYTSDGNTTTESFDACIIAVPPPLARNLYPQLNGERKSFIDSVEYDANLAVHIGLSHKPSNRETLIMYPERETDDAGVAYLNHNKAPGRAPEGKGSVSLYFTTKWSNANYDIDDQVLIDIAVERLAPFVDNLQNNIEVARTNRWQRFAMNEKPGTYKQTNDYNRSIQSQRDQRVQFASDFIPRSGVNQAVSNGFACAERVIYQLLPHRRTS